MNRRIFLSGLAAAATLAAQAPPEVSTPGRPQATDSFGPSVDNVPIIDAHIHLFDGTRPQGATYMGSAEFRALSKTSLPELYEPLARPTGIVGAVVVESSGWVEDNLWYLMVSEPSPFIVGISGRLDPYKPEFGEYLERYSKNPLYRAIRASRFYAETNGKVTLDAVAVDNLKLLAQADLANDTANPSIALMTANVMLADAVPNLRIIMDHLPRFDPDDQSAYEAVITEMAARSNIFVKLSAAYRSSNAAGIQDRLEYLYGMFGEDRVIFGTDYPNSYGVATLSEEVGLMKQFFSTKTRAQAEKFFWRNAAHVYKYAKRAGDQP
ncbi:MAG: amidohydrolase family protein [Acidobacteria bacterium]|nr:amidohydrolase family protein [Acidobacteriota bacterium]MDA1236363.1 amidohydrolase family protein [Acidobacteriota bacterium]